MQNDNSFLANVTRRNFLAASAGTAISFPQAVSANFPKKLGNATHLLSVNVEKISGPSCWCS
jgi:hypothetical protein